MAKKKTNHHVVTDDEIRQFNLMRENKKGKEFSRTEMKDTLSRLMGYTKADALLRALCDGINPPVVKLSRGKYMFAKEPVFRDRLQTAWDAYTKFANPQKYKTGNYADTVSVETCIKVLKEHGYRIQKPVTKWEEV